MREGSTPSVPTTPNNHGGYSTVVSALVCGTSDEGSNPSSHPRKISAPLAGGGIFLKCLEKGLERAAVRRV